MITVADLRERLTDEGLKLIAGEDGIDNQVKYLTIMELVGKSSRIKKKGFVISTFHAFTRLDDIMEQLKWLNEIGISGVGFHTASYKKIPEKVITFSNNHSLPLFYIPGDTPYYRIFDKYNQMVHEKKDWEMKEIYKLNKKLMESVLSEKDLNYITRVVGSYIDNLVIVLDQYLDLLASWKRQDQKKEDVEMLLDFLIQKKKEAFLTARFSNRETTIHVEHLQINVKKFTVYPIKSKMNFFGYMLICQDGLEGDFINEVIRNGIRALTLTAHNRYAMNRLQKEEDIELMEGIFKEEVNEAAESEFHMNIRNIRQIFLANPDSIDEQYRLLEILKEIFDKKERDSLVWLYNNRIVGVIDITLNDDHLESVRKVIPLVRFGTSSSIKEPNISSIRTMYKQADYALKYCIRNNLAITRWEDIGIEKAAYHLSRDPLFIELDSEVLGPLLDYDKEKNSELTETLYCYLKNFFNIQKTSSELFVHPNTVRYRLHKINEILAMDIQHPSNYSMLILAYELHKLRF